MSNTPATSIEQIDAWRGAASESQHLEFKEARTHFEMPRLRDASGATVMVEIYTDRIEISNPGQPGVQPERFIDEYRCRNEPLADLMRRFGICEEKGSGIDKVVHAVEERHLPAPEFRVDSVRTTCVLHGAREFAEMSREDRIRACYQHCCLRYVSNEAMTNRSLRERFGLAEHQTAVASHIITATQAAGLIKPDGALTSSKRYAREWHSSCAISLKAWKILILRHSHLILADAEPRPRHYLDRRMRADGGEHLSVVVPIPPSAALFCDAVLRPTRSVSLADDDCDQCRARSFASETHLARDGDCASTRQETMRNCFEIVQKCARREEHVTVMKLIPLAHASSGFELDLGILHDSKSDNVRT